MTASIGETEVLIVGAGPVGLALAIELGTRGIRVVVVEQNARVGNNPRAKTTNVRTMELLRRWGLADKVRAASPLPRKSCASAKRSDFIRSYVASNTSFIRSVRLIRTSTIWMPKA